MCVRLTATKLKANLVLDGDARSLAVISDVLGEGVEVAAHLHVNRRLVVRELQDEGMGRRLVLEGLQQDGGFLLGVLAAARLAWAAL